MECTFCEITRKRLENFVFELEHWVSFFDRNPVSPRHMLIIPKRHVNGMENLSTDEWVELHEILRKVIKYAMNYKC